MGMNCTVSFKALRPEPAGIDCENVEVAGSTIALTQASGRDCMLYSGRVETCFPMKSVAGAPFVRMPVEYDQLPGLYDSFWISVSSAGQITRIFTRDDSDTGSPATLRFLRGIVSGFSASMPEDATTVQHARELREPSDAEEFRRAHHRELLERGDTAYDAVEVNENGAFRTRYVVGRARGLAAAGVSATFPVFDGSAREVVLLRRHISDEEQIATITGLKESEDWLERNPGPGQSRKLSQNEDRSGGSRVRLHMLTTMAVDSDRGLMHASTRALVGKRRRKVSPLREKVAEMKAASSDQRGPMGVKHTLPSTAFAATWVEMDIARLADDSFVVDDQQEELFAPPSHLKDEPEGPRRLLNVGTAHQWVREHSLSTTVEEHEALRAEKIADSSMTDDREFEEFLQCLDLPESAGTQERHAMYKDCLYAMAALARVREELRLDIEGALGPGYNKLLHSRPVAATRLIHVVSLFPSPPLQFALARILLSMPHDVGDAYEGSTAARAFRAAVTTVSALPNPANELMEALEAAMYDHHRHIRMYDELLMAYAAGAYETRSAAVRARAVARVSRELNRALARHDKLMGVHREHHNDALRRWSSMSLGNRLKWLSHANNWHNPVAAHELWQEATEAERNHWANATTRLMTRMLSVNRGLDFDPATRVPNRPANSSFDTFADLLTVGHTELRTCILAAANLRDVATLPTLVTLARRDELVQLRPATISALLAIRDVVAEEALVDLVLTDTEMPRHRILAADGLLRWQDAGYNVSSASVGRFLGFLGRNYNVSWRACSNECASRCIHRPLQACGAQCSSRCDEIARVESRVAFILAEHWHLHSHMPREIARLVAHHTAADPIDEEVVAKGGRRLTSIMTILDISPSRLSPGILPDDTDVMLELMLPDSGFDVDIEALLAEFAKVLQLTKFQLRKGIDQEWKDGFGDTSFFAGFAGLGIKNAVSINVGLFGGFWDVSWLLFAVFLVLLC